MDPGSSSPLPLPHSPTYEHESCFQITSRDSFVTPWQSPGLSNLLPAAIKQIQPGWERLEGSNCQLTSVEDLAAASLKGVVEEVRSLLWARAWLMGVEEAGTAGRAGQEKVTVSSRTSTMRGSRNMLLLLPAKGVRCPGC